MAQFDLVRQGAASTNNDNPAVTLSGAPAQGNLVVSVVGTSSNQTIAGGWTGATNQVTDVDRGRVYYKIAGAGESATQQPCTTTGGASWSCVISEYEGPFDASPLEVSTENVDADATKTTTGSCDPTDSVLRLVIGAVFSDGARTFSADKVNGSTSGVANALTASGGIAGSGSSCRLFDKKETSTASGNYTAESVASVSDNGGAFIAIFVPGALGGAVQQMLSLLGVGS